MKVKIGKFKNWIGPFQIADLFKIFGMSEETCFQLGEWLAEDKDGNDSLLMKLCQKIDNLRTRNVKVFIHDYDVWNMDGTLAYIILPMLIKLKEDKHGYPRVDDIDVPYDIKGNSDDPWVNGKEKWDFILNELIWTFEQIHPDNDWEEQYTTGKSDFVIKDGQLTNGPKHTAKFDQEGWTKHNERIQRGCILFGKYYQALWT